MDDNQPPLNPVPESPPHAPQKLEKKNPSKKLLLIIVAVFIVLFFGVTISLFIATSKKTQYQSEANKNYNAGNYKEAESAAKKGLQEFPNDTYLLRKVIDSKTAEGNATGKEKKALEDAKPYIDKALSINPNEYETLLSAGYAYEAAGDYEKALGFYQKAAQIKPTATAFFHVGHTLSFLNREPEAQAAYQKANKLDPNNPQIGLLTARILHDEGKDEEALKILTYVGKLSSLEKNIRAEAYTDAAIIYLEKNDRAKAAEFAKQAITIDETYSPGLGIYGFSLVRSTKDYAEGRKYILKAIEQNSRISLNYLLAGQLLRSVGYKTQALVYQKKGIDHVNDDNTLVGDSAKQKMKAKMYFELAETYAQLGDIGQTISSMKLAIENNPKYKSVIENAVKSGYFKSIKNNPVFSAFLKS